MKQLYYVIRTLLRGRGSNIIKVISLGLGLTMSILLFSRVAFEQSYDTFYKDYDNLYQIFSIFSADGEQFEPQKQNCGPVAGAILENFPKEVEAATSIAYFLGGPLYNGSVRFDDEILLADSLFFRTMGIEVLSGNPENELVQPDVIFLSDRLAQKIFGGENPIGKVLSYNKEITFTVKGTYAALPENTTMRPEGVVSMPTAWSRSWGNYSWRGGDSYYEYIRFRPGADKEIINARLDDMIQKYRPEEDKKAYGYTAFVKPIRDVYRNEDQVKRMDSIMSILAFAILFIAALNYVLISISSLTYRAKAVGVHKCSGASGGTVFSMFLLETGIIIVLALVLMGLILLNFQEFIEDTTAAKLSVLFAPDRIWVPLAVVLVLFVVGGVLPGRLFARIPVSQVFRRYTEGKKGWKRPLLFIQFAGVAFICGLMYVVMAQYNYVKDKDMGYNPQRVAVGNAYFGSEEESGPALQFFRGLPYVEEVSSAVSTPIWSYSGSMIEGESGQSLFSTRYSFALEDYFKMMGMTMKEGRAPRAADEIVVNEAFAERMRWGDKALNHPLRTEGKNFKVVGILKDFHIGSYYQPQDVIMFGYTRTFGNTVHVRLKEPFAENLRRLNKDVNEAYPDKTIDFAGLEQRILERYNPVRVFSNATILAAVTMFFVMLMGLIGYTTDEVRRRSKEIAIRKVNGAESSGILELLSKDVLYVAGPAVIIGIIASAYVNEMWMDQFAAQVPLSWPVYVLIALVILLFIVACVIWKSWRIANENPVKSIKSE
ncbi:ABC transporter permease [Bacteroides intestinalis]|uniref:ABC transporter permease n=1 Tax=Bacteroides intestinalis TaxID=329854 RepID=A0A412XRA1_9BACE|nr:ABC transporter permease [Bacteroides intestinalis]RGV47744.1 ABC transporter permease [Bacteroides intestinalis]RHA53645.1 ABC transporter permease [Bacteroides intestinalis]